MLYSNILVDSNCYGVILCCFLSLWLLAFRKIRTAQDLAVNAFLRDLTVEEYSDFKLKDLTHFGEEEEQIELEVGRSPLIAHELLRNKLYNCFVSSSPSAVNMTSQRKTLENNSRKLRRLLRKQRSQLDRLVLNTTFSSSCSGLISPYFSVTTHHIFQTGTVKKVRGFLYRKLTF